VEQNVAVGTFADLIEMTLQQSPLADDDQQQANAHVRTLRYCCQKFPSGSIGYEVANYDLIRANSKIIKSTIDALVALGKKGVSPSQ
jgi:hypothetical protein